jgi:hypothetical protein
MKAAFFATTAIILARGSMIASDANHMNQKRPIHHRSDKKPCQPLAKFKKLFTFANEMQQEIMNFTPPYRPLVPERLLRRR